jgi:hypothetical protein
MMPPIAFVTNKKKVFFLYYIVLQFFVCIKRSNYKYDINFKYILEITTIYKTYK